MYTPAKERYETMEYNRCGESGLMLPKVSLGLWHNFGDTANFENMRKLCFKPGSSIVDAPTPAEVEEDEDKLYLGHIFDAASYMVEYFKPVVRE